MGKYYDVARFIGMLSYLSHHAAGEGANRVAVSIQTIISDMETWQNAYDSNIVTEKEYREFIRDQHNLVFDDLLFTWCIQRALKHTAPLNAARPVNTHNIANLCENSVNA